ncbi:MAG TPA: DUF4410 domain-containing protein [Pyrinomonadaceae bacterium]|nr:DUF4410 domain-containing protein [Pyrinomonadaceae bacterium]
MRVGPSCIARKTMSLFLALVGLTVVGVSTVTAQTKSNDLKNRYENIEVVPFDVKASLEFPDEYRTRMIAGVVKDLREINKFKRVFAEGETQTGESGSTLRLKGTVIKYKHGNRGKRFFALGLAGDTKIVAHVKFIDKTTGKLLVEADVDGQIYTGLVGGSPRGAPTGIGKDIAKIAKKVFF